MNYTIFTDTGCDISPRRLTEWNVRCIDLTFRKNDDTVMYTNRDIPADAFYALMRSGVVYRTSAVNADTFRDAFYREAEKGNDVLYVGLSSGLSGTMNAAFAAAREVSLLFPDRKIRVLDSLCASAGQGMLLYYAAKNREKYDSADAMYDYLSSLVPRMAHWFTVDDLVYLKRGGRISAASAFAATALGIKPVMHMDDSGHLVNVKKVHGRRQALRETVSAFQRLADPAAEGEYFISHADCAEDAMLAEKLLYELTGKKAALITDIGPVIGSHCGPGTFALFFLAKER